MTEAYGKNGIYAKVVQHSCDADNPSNEVLTVNVKYGLLVHAEFLRHRQLSRGVKSNRAVPTSLLRKEVLDDPYVPVWFGAAQKGMVADKEVRFKWLARQIWLKSRYFACAAHYLAGKLGGHKEWVNRLINPWQFVRETITATEWDNLYNLRLHKDAQKDIKEIVDCIYEAHKKSSPVELNSGEWHVPYLHRSRIDGVMRYFEKSRYPIPFFSLSKTVTASEIQSPDTSTIDKDTLGLSSEEAIKCSAARCARSSYDNHDGTSTTLEGDMKLYNMLIESEPKHASPVEHQATPMQSREGFYNNSLGEIFQERGVTHLDKDLNFWSGNYKGFIQYRQTLDNHVCTDYKDHN